MLMNPRRVEIFDGAVQDHLAPTRLVDLLARRCCVRRLSSGVLDSSLDGASNAPSSQVSTLRCAAQRSIDCIFLPRLLTSPARPRLFRSSHKEHSVVTASLRPIYSTSVHRVDSPGEERQAADTVSRRIDGAFEFESCCVSHVVRCSCCVQCITLVLYRLLASIEAVHSSSIHRRCFGSSLGCTARPSHDHQHHSISLVCVPCIVLCLLIVQRFESKRRNRSADERLIGL